MFPRRHLTGRVLLVGLVLLGVGGPASRVAYAQVTPYVVTHDFAATFNPLPAGLATSHVPNAYGTLDRWDEGAVRIPIGFDFDFFGRTYREVWAYTNGFVAFRPPPSRVTILPPPAAVPRSTDPIDAYIAPMWQDLDRDRTTTPLPPPPAILSRVDGAPGSRTFTLEYRGFKRARAQQSNVDFQIELSEGSQRVRVSYGPNDGIVNATAALEGAGGTDGFSLFRASATCTGSCPCGPVSCSSVPSFPSGLSIDVELPASRELVGAVTGPPGARAGASFDARVVARNAGLVATGGFDYDVYLSPSDTSTAGADRLGRFRVGSGLGPVSSETATRAFTVPAGTPASTRYLAVAVDVAGEVDEAFEDNNLAFGGPFNIGPDLRGRLEVPRLSGPGATLPVELAIENAGAPETRSFDVRLWLSADASPDPQDTLLDTVTLGLPDGLGRSGPIAVRVPLSVPVSPPSYRVLAELDASDVVDEVDETNNLVVSSGLVEVVGPELIVARVDSATIAVRGAPYPVEVEVENAGGGLAAGITACVLLRTDPSFDLVGDPRLAETVPFDLRAGERARLRLEPVIPADQSALARFLGAGVDCGGAVDEPNEADNVIPRTAGPIEIRDPAPDWRVDDLAPPARVAAGEEAEVRVRVANRGSDSGSPTLALVASPDPALGPSDPELTRATLGSLAPGEVAVVRLAGVLSPLTPAGSTWLGVRVDPDDAVREADETDNAVGAGPIPVDGGALSVIGPPPPPAELGRPYLWAFSASGGETERDWTLWWASGAPPPGLAFDPAAGRLSGTPAPAGEGRHDFEVTVRSGRAAARRTGTLLVVPPNLSLQVVNRRLDPARRDSPYDAALLAVGGTPPYAWRTGEEGELPLGLAVSPEGRVSGEPAGPGAYVFRAVVEDAVGRTAAAPVAVDVIEAEAGLQITTADIPAGMVGMAYATRLLAPAAEGPVRWSVEGGPPGLSVDPATGTYAGAPSEAGLFAAVVEVLETGGAERSDRAAFVVEVVERGELFILGGVRLPDAALGAPYQVDGAVVALEAEPDDGALRWSVLEGDLPPGLVLTAAGVIEGNPAEAGRWAFAAQVRNGANETRRATRVLQVVDPAARTPGPVDEGGCRGVGRPRPGLPSLGLLLLGVGVVLRLRRRR